MMESEFVALFDRVEATAARLPLDETGTVALIDDAARDRASSSITGSDVVSCVASPPTIAIDSSTDSIPGERWTAWNETHAFEAHGRSGATHIDGFRHFQWDGRGYGRGVDGRDLEAISHRGIFTRGVFVDLSEAAHRGDVPPGTPCSPDCLSAILARDEVELLPGDALVIRLSRADGLVGGLSVHCIDALQTAGISLIVTDDGAESVPSEVHGVVVPWHVLALVAAGIHLVDLADLDRLAAACLRHGRTTFALSLGITAFSGATSALAAPLAIF